MAIEIQPDGRFGNYLHHAMSAADMDVKTLATKIESTYEHLRKLIKGLAYPSQFMLDNLAKAIKGFDKKEALALVEQDKAQKKFKNFHKMTNRNPEMDPLEKVWGLLSQDRKNDLIKMAQVWAKEK